MRSGHKPRILALVQLPPPLHGAAAMNKLVVSSQVLNDHFDIEVFPIQLSQHRLDMGSISLRKLFITVSRSVKLFAVLLFKRPKLVYFTLPHLGGAFYANLPLVLLVKLFRVSLLYHFHGKGLAKQAEKSKLYRAAMKWALSRSRVILLSPLLFEDVSQFVNKDDSVFIPNGISTSELSAVPEKEGGARQESLGASRILFLSNLIPSKGPLILLDALTLLKAGGVEFHAVFAGAESSAISSVRFLKEIQSRNLQDNVDYVGPVAGKAKMHLFNEADIFVLPTCNDAFPLVLLEAMSAGLPVVTTNEGAIPDMIGDGRNGRIVPQNNPEFLAAALAELLRNPNMRQVIGEKNKVKVETEFTVEKFEKRMLVEWLRATNSIYNAS